MLTYNKITSNIIYINLTTISDSLLWFRSAVPRKPARSQDASIATSHDSAASLLATSDHEPPVKRGSKVLSFFRGNESVRERSPNRRCDVTGAAVRYTPRLDRDSTEDNGNFHTSIR